MINVAGIPGSIVLAKQRKISKISYPHFSNGAFKHLLD